MKQSIFIFTAFLFSTQICGQNFQSNPQGIRQMAMGGSGTALTWNSDIVYYNPAGMADLNLWEASISGVARLRNTAYSKGGYRTQTARQTELPFNFYVAGPIRRAKSKIAVGVGIYTPYSNNIDWDDRWPGRNIVQQSSFRTIFAQPTVSYKFNRNFAFGAGYVVGIAETENSYAMAAPGPDGNESSRTLSARPWGRGFTAGMYYKLNKWVQLGLSYRSEMKLYSDQGTAVHSVLASLQDSFPETKYTSEIHLPHTGSFGIGYRPNYRLTIQADVSYTFYIKTDSGKIDFAENTSLQRDITVARKYRNAFSYRAGFNYAFSEKFAGMLGGAWEETFSSDNYISPEFPDTDKIRVSGGIYYRPISAISITVALAYAVIPQFNAYYAPMNFSGDYRQQDISAGVGIAVDF
jgi:long-chain fatty acid transport protein